MRIVASLLALLAFVAQPAAAASSPSLLEPRAAAELPRRRQVGRRRHRRARPQHRRDRQHQGQHALPDGEHGQGRGRRALSRAGRSRPPLARRHDQRPVGAQPDGADADPQRQSRDRHPAAATLAARARSTTGCRHNGVTGLRVDRTIAQLLQRQARPVGPPRFRARRRRWSTCLRRIYKAELIKPAEPQLPARPDGPVRDRQEPDEGAAPEGTPVEHKTGTLERPRRRRRLHHLARRPPGRGRDLHPRRHRPSAHHRRGRARDLRRLQGRSSPGRSARRSPHSRCFSTSLPAERSAALRRPSWSSAI